MGLVVPRHVGSSRTRAQTGVPCIGRWILNHWATREAPFLFLFLHLFFCFFKNVLNWMLSPFIFILSGLAVSVYKVVNFPSSNTLRLCHLPDALETEGEKCPPHPSRAPDFCPLHSFEKYSFLGTLKGTCLFSLHIAYASRFLGFPKIKSQGRQLYTFMCDSTIPWWGCRWAYKTPV